MPDYEALIDSEVRAFMARTAKIYPANAVDLSIAEQRRFYDELCRAFDAGRPVGLGVDDETFGGVPCRVYTPPGPRATVLFCHGGGFVVGGLDSHDSICAEIAEGAGMRVVAVDYRLSPEYPHPSDFKDVLAAHEAVEVAFGGPLLLCGDSAGGNLVAALAQARRHVGFAGQVLIYPGLGGDRTQGSYVTHAEAPGLTTRDMAAYERLRSGGADKRGDPTFAPLSDRNFKGLPRSVILTAECDPLSSDGAAYAARLDAAGVPALWHEEPGLIHGHLRARHVSARARAAFGRVIESLGALHAGRLPAFS